MLPAVTAVIEYNPLEIPKFWEVIESDRIFFIRLCKNTSLIETGSVIAQIARYNRIGENARTARELIEEIIASGNLVVGGGLQAIRQQKTISPGCCCGLEMWRDWFDLSPEHKGVWLGHDPSPWAEYVASENIVRVWSDCQPESRSAQIFHIDFPFPYLQECLSQVATDLNDFLQKVEHWSEQFGNDLASDLTEKLRTDFNI